MQLLLGVKFEAVANVFKSQDHCSYERKLIWVDDSRIYSYVLVGVATCHSSPFSCMTTQFRHCNTHTYTHSWHTTSGGIMLLCTLYSCTSWPKGGASDFCILLFTRIDANAKLLMPLPHCNTNTNFRVIDLLELYLYCRCRVGCFLWLLSRTILLWSQARDCRQQGYWNSCDIEYKTLWLQTIWL